MNRFEAESSYRVFVDRINSSFWAWAIGKSQNIYSIHKAESPEAALSELDLHLPPKSQIHVAATPLQIPYEIVLRNKKLLHISKSSGLREYEIFDNLQNKGLPTEIELQQSQKHLLINFNESEIEETLRSAHRKNFILHLQRHSILNEYKLSTLINKSLKAPRLLLHVCCGPDAAGVIHQLKEDYDLTCFWYDPNIQPQQEHDKRLEAFVKISEIENVPYIIGEYDVNSFYQSIKGLEATPEQGAKCSKCYDMRLERAAHEAKSKNFDLYATTLAISPHKVQSKLIAFGELNEARYGIPYYHRNFMKNDGFKRSVELTEEHSIYRQDYCGCYFSLQEGGPTAQWLGETLKIEPTSKIEFRPLNISENVFEEYQNKLSQSSRSKRQG